MEALRWVLLCEEEVEDEEEPVAEECLLVPLVMGLGRTLARDRLLAVRASLASYNGTTQMFHFSPLMLYEYFWDFITLIIFMFFQAANTVEQS